MHALALGSAFALGWPAEVVADGLEGGDEGAHVGFGVEGRRGDAQALLTTRHRRIVDRLDVDGVLGDQALADAAAEVGRVRC